MTLALSSTSTNYAIGFQSPLSFFERSKMMEKKAQATQDLANKSLGESSNASVKQGRKRKFKELSINLPDNPNFKGLDGEVYLLTLPSGSPVAVKKFKREKSGREEIAMTEELKYAAHFVFYRETIKKPLAMVMDSPADKDLLHRILESKSGLTLTQTLMLAKQGFEFLEAIHSLGKVHRDMKPDNIVCNEQIDQFTVIDLGMAKKNGDSIQKGATFTYASPEYALRLPTSFAQDIWSFGCTLFVTYTCTSMIYAFKDTKINVGSDAYYAEYKKFLQEMQLRFGEFPQKLIKNSNEVLRSKFFRQENGRYVLPKGNFQFNGDWEAIIRSRAQLKKDPPEHVNAFIELLKKMLVYEGRISAQEALQLPLFQNDIGFFINAPVGLEGELVIRFEKKKRDKKTKYERVFDLRDKDLWKLCHHIPKSDSGHYEVILRNAKEELKRGSVEISQGGVLQVS